MFFLFRRYAHVPLALVSVLLIAIVIAWILERRVDGVWDPALRIAAPIPTAVSITPAPAAPARPDEAASTPEPATTPAPALQLEPPPAVPPVPSAPPPPAAAPGARYVLESGPFLSAEVADRVEDQLHQLGYATARFHKQEVRRLYRVVLAGFGSAAEARQAVGELDRGVVVTGDDGPEVLIERHPTLQGAVAAARALRAHGREARVGESVAPTVIYHIRYGQFASQAQAAVRSEELAALGVASQVVTLR